MELELTVYSEENEKDIRSYSVNHLNKNFCVLYRTSWKQAQKLGIGQQIVGKIFCPYRKVNRVCVW